MISFTQGLEWEKATEEKGIVVAISREQEWLLPLWWSNYSQFNSYPVLFVDFGMSSQAKKWCKEKGRLLKLTPPEQFMADKNSIPQNLSQKWHQHFQKVHNTPKRVYWFQKPLAMLKSNFKKTLWLDLDCIVRGALEPVFYFLNKKKLGCVKEPPHIQTKRLQLGLREKREILYNSGVLVYSHGISFMQQWAKAAIEENHLFYGDQELFSNLVFRKKMKLAQMPLSYNWPIFYGINPEAKIVHYINDSGKDLLRKMLQMPFVC